MVNILCIETTTTNCSVALSVNGSVSVLQEDYGQKYSHAELLHVYIEKILHKANLQLKNLHAIAVSKGPGSYTGLRIGVSSAKGLCFAQDIPLISTATLETLAHQVSASKGFIIPMIDARRMEAFTAVFKTNYDQVRETQAQVLNDDSFTSFLNEDKTYFIGNSNAKFAEICTHTNAVFINDKLPSAKEMCSLAYKKYQENNFEDLAYFEPYYGKDFVSG